MWVDVEGGRLYVESTGSGTPLLLVHGWPLDHRLFEPQVRQLADRHQVVTFDRRGFGISQARPDLRLEVDDIARIIDALSLGPVHLLGMSQGARIALRFALTRRQLICSLLLQGPAVDGFEAHEAPGERIPIEEYARLARAGRLDEVRRRWGAHPMMALDDAAGDARKLLKDIMQDYRGADLLAPPAAAAMPLLDEARAFRRPCLLLTGADETAARRAHAQKLLELMPNCRQVTLKRSGHLSHLTEPGAYNRHVREFCARADAESAASGAGGLD